MFRSLLAGSLLAGSLLASCSQGQPEGASQEQVRGNAEENHRTVSCASVLPEALVAQSLGVATTRLRPPAREAARATLDCVYTVPSSTVEASISLDCRPVHPRLEAITRSFESVADYALVDIGIGGAYAFDRESEQHRLTLESENPSCAVYIAISKLLIDRTQRLARTLVSRLTPETAPR